MPGEDEKGAFKMEQGKLHIYCGDGKGKTTAAAGLALRCAGSGRKVVFVQFLKDGTSSEIKILRQIPGIEVLTCPENFGFTFRMTEETRARAAAAYQALFDRAVRRAEEVQADLLVLDESIGAYQAMLLDPRAVLTFLCEKPAHLEVVLTGRDPGEELLGLADYVTEMRCIRHPYAQGLPAREGIEY